MHSLIELLAGVVYFILDVASSAFGNQSQQVQPRAKKKVTKKG